MLKTLTFILNIFNTNTLDLLQNRCNFASQLRNNGEPNQHQIIVNPQLARVMETNNSTILPLYDNNKIGGYTHIKISLDYDKGGMNYFSGNINPRGIYLYIQPTNASGCQYTILGNSRACGGKILIKELSRRNRKTEDTTWATITPFLGEIVENYTIGRNDLIFALLKRISILPTE